MDDDIADSLDEIGQFDQTVMVAECSDPAELVIKDLTDTTLNELELVVSPKKKKSTSNGYKLSLTTTLQSPRYKPIPRESPMEIGGGACKKCGVIVNLDDYLGFPEHGSFKAVGYHCHKCNHRWLREKYCADETRSGQSYMTKSKWELKRG